MAQVVILAGDGDTPALTDIGGTPLLGRQLAIIARSAQRDVLVLSGSAAIARYCGDGDRWGLAVRVAPRAGEAAGEAGTMVVLPGDVLLDVDLDRLLDHHRRQGADATLLLRPSDRPAEADLVDRAEDGRVRGIHVPPHVGDFHNQAWPGAYVVEWPALAGGDLLGRPLVDCLLRAGCLVQSYLSPEYVRRVASAGDLDQARADVAAGLPDRLSLRSPQPAVFLDRDGVLNVEKGSVNSVAALELIPSAAPALARLNRAGFRTPVVTNQAAVARGLCTLETLDAIHARLETELGVRQAYVDRIYFCPHHPDPALPGGVPSLLVRCDCRKPKPGMARAAMADLNIDIAHSWIVGDSSSDMGLARICGMGGILVRDGHGGRDGKSPAQPHVVVDDLADAVRFILDVWPGLSAHLDGLAAGIAPGDVVLVGGLARAGKSLLAQCLSLRLGQRGHRAVVLGLDSWLKSHDRRGVGVLGRYDLKAAGQALAAVANRGTAITPPRYDVLTQTSHPGREDVVLGPDDILIVEGVPALTQPAWRALATRRLYVATDEAGRRARFHAEYRRRGWSDDRIESTYEDRLRDERPIVLASKGYADTETSLDGLLD
ncbi:histidinol-phosphate phosphatase family [Nitrospirillum viridazoti Y2]|uniref:D,D-heptose 1,7-bisphosphate phosphatase n=1 Tax=Nitrospirillum amazonense TaxID=28077 RepID=A0A560HXW4_9PROT|nr:histidinol-phosphate phosphatase family [Nitrospirillum amazonense Y2]TWB51493.1 D,D-heptose 1,7-bisphosphate phosphatase [Nitrospirillum amazonense]